MRAALGFSHLSQTKGFSLFNRMLSHLAAKSAYCAVSCQPRWSSTAAWSCICWGLLIFERKLPFPPPTPFFPTIYSIALTAAATSESLWLWDWNSSVEFVFTHLQYQISAELYIEIGLHLWIIKKKKKKSLLYFWKPQGHKDRLCELLSLPKLLVKEELLSTLHCFSSLTIGTTVITKYFKSCQYKHDLEMENTVLVIASGN